MAKFCGRCGAKLDEVTGICPNCDGINFSTKDYKQIEDTYGNASDITIGKKIRRFLLKILLWIILFAFLGFIISGVLTYFELIDAPFMESMLNKIGIMSSSNDIYREEQMGDNDYFILESETKTEESAKTNNETIAEIKAETEITDDSYEETETVKRAETESAKANKIEQKKSFESRSEKSLQQEIVEKGNLLDTNYLNSILSNTGASFSSYLLDVTNYQEYDTGYCDEKMYTSALVGIPVLFTIAEGIDSGIYSLDDMVQFHYSVYGRGKMTADQDGDYYSLDALIKEAFLYSDNNAINSLIDYVELYNINFTCQSYGYASVDIQRKIVVEDTPLDNYCSAKDAVLMLNAIYQNNFSGINRNYLYSILKIDSSDSANKGLYTSLKHADTFLNFNGITSDRYTEIGLIENGNKVYIICILMNGVSSEKEAAAVSDYASYVNGKL